MVTHLTEPPVLSALRYVEPLVVALTFLVLVSLAAFLVRSALRTEWMLARILHQLKGAQGDDSQIVFRLN